MDWLYWLIVTGVILCSILGVLLTAATLPGIWFMILAASLAQAWSLSDGSSAATPTRSGAGSGLPSDAVASATGAFGTHAASADGLIRTAVTDPAMFSWWTLGIAAGLALIAELVEFGASAVGAAKAGGTRRGAIGSVIGALVGAVGGSVIVPILGTIIGAALGAGIGALLFERHDGRKSWKDASKIGAGAAAGRLVATLAKVVIACVVAVMLIVDAIA